MNRFLILSAPPVMDALTANLWLPGVNSPIAGGLGIGAAATSTIDLGSLFLLEVRGLIPCFAMAALKAFSPGSKVIVKVEKRAGANLSSKPTKSKASKPSRPSQEKKPAPARKKQIVKSRKEPALARLRSGLITRWKSLNQSLQHYLKIDAKSRHKQSHLSIEPQQRQVQLLQPPLKVKGRKPRKTSIWLGEEVEHRCPYCLDLVEEHDPRGVKICPICHTYHHADCWAITGVCQVPHYHG